MKIPSLAAAVCLLGCQFMGKAPHFEPSEQSLEEQRSRKLDDINDDIQAHLAQSRKELRQAIEARSNEIDGHMQECQAMTNDNARAQCITLVQQERQDLINGTSGSGSMGESNKTPCAILAQESQGINGRPCSNSGAPIAPARSGRCVPDWEGGPPGEGCAQVVH